MTPDQIDLSAVVNPWQALVLVVLILCIMVVPQVGAWVQARRSAAAVHEVRTTLQQANGGGSVRDSLDRIERRQREQGDQLTAVVQRVEALERRRRWKARSHESR